MAQIEGRIGATDGQTMISKDSDEFGGDLIRGEGLEAFHTLIDDLRETERETDRQREEREVKTQRERDIEVRREAQIEK
jgi:hypothetical protein